MLSWHRRPFNYPQVFIRIKILFCGGGGGGGGGGERGWGGGNYKTYRGCMNDRVSLIPKFCGISGYPGVSLLLIHILACRNFKPCIVVIN